MPTAQQVYQMLGNESVWDVVRELHRELTVAARPYALCGDVAVCLHGYQRNTVDVDLLIRPTDSEKVRETLAAAGLTWVDGQKEFRSASGVAVQFLLTGDRAGSGSEILLPEPLGEFTVEEIEGLPVLKLSKLLETKIACGLGSVRRTHKDVVELIAIRNLDSSFARFLHKSVRETFRKLVRNARDEA